jgi:hypothetical protein
MANDNWLQSKSGKKHKIGVNFLYVTIQNSHRWNALVTQHVSSVLIFF